jgi:uncharacterized protein involved in exopolysaccharide biosynthesis/Mrp family chromosome partitioning ATPase
MELIEQETIPSGIGLNDVLFMVFRHKWKIAICTLAGIAAAATVFVMSSRDYESRAKLLVKYVSEGNTIDPADRQVKPVVQSDTMVNTEVEILTSTDVAMQVVEAPGFERLLPKFSKADSKLALASTSPTPAQPGGAESKAEAVRSILEDMTVEARKGSNVITVSYKNRDPEVARAVLVGVVAEYLREHFDVHRSLGAFDFVSKQATRVQNELVKIEADLTRKKEAAGVLNLSEGIANLSSRRAKIEEALLAAQSEFAEQQARLKERERQMTGGNPTEADAKQGEGQATESDANTKEGEGKVKENQAKTGDNQMKTPPAAVDKGEVQRYQLLLEQVAQLNKTELELLTKFTPENQNVKTARHQIEDLNRERRELEERFPALLAVVPKAASSTNGPETDIVSERANLAAVAAKIETLNAQLKTTQEQAVRLAALAPDIARLERKKEVGETNLTYIESSLEKATTDETLRKDGKTTSDISVVQNPSTGMKVAGKTQKIVLGLAGGGFGLGVGIALLIELLLNRSIRRPLELETRLQIPQLLSIPYLADRPRLLLQSGEENTSDSDGAVRKLAPLEVEAWDAGHFIRSFAEEIRDRLILSFRLKNLTHKPKLVGIAGLSGGEGASTLAGSLAAALSETGDGKVLLVDLRTGHSEAHPFADGKPAWGLLEALEANGTLPPVADNLYMASGVSQNGRSAQFAAKRFYALIPNLKASHFDYIIFDLPPVTQGSGTLAIAGCLDKLLFVVEAEKSDRDEVKRAYAELVAAKADVAGILNKTRSSGPKWLSA